MNIAIACNAFKQSGGLERYALDVVRGLNRANVRPIVFARSFDDRLLRECAVDPVPINVRWLPGKLRDQFFARRVAALRQQYRVDLLIGVNRTDCAEIAICGGTHRGYLRSLDREPTWSDRRQIALESSQYAHAHTVVAHSEMMAHELRSLYGMPDEKVKVLYPPVDQVNFRTLDSVAGQAERQAWRARHGIGDDKIVFLFPSNSHHRKGYARLAAFFAKTSLPIVLAVVGRPIPDTSDAIRYLGYASDIAEAYRAADVTILASRYEPFGLVGVESLLCGTPVVLDRRIACTEVLPSSDCYVFDGDIPDDLARAVTAAMQRCLARRTKVRDMDTQASLDDSTSLPVGYDPNIDQHVAALLSLIPPRRHTPVGHHGESNAFRPRATA
ncbi:glycosyltransferase family 4 protein [Robbsia andropogonis]|uniref:glycosyltransferase family 4 protein n=1 Tax=Robbsia andropogonis TaxID=28092 RepID=UPI000463B399|nr:glycosyltransferase family 4 protein [Robbsia andropogonis]MCP1116756.1 glycosyltransferase family 4 protein [Robbsia andropogonis]MCP1126565.1 glycosyltransferase family 4 protein [Robbsia andropogonis]